MSPFPPAPYPGADREGEEAPRAMPGTRRSASRGIRKARGPCLPFALSAEPGGETVPAVEVAQPARRRPGGRRRAGTLKFTPFSVLCCALPLGKGSHGLSPAAAGLRGPAASLWRLGAVEQLPLLGPSSVLQADTPHPSEEMGEAGGCVRETKEGGRKWGAKQSPHVWVTSGAAGGAGAEAGLRHTPLGLPLTRVPGSPTACRPARSVRNSGSVVRPSPHPTSSRPDPGANCDSVRRARGARRHLPAEIRLKVWGQK